MCSKEFDLNAKYMVAHFESENRYFNRKAVGKDGEMGIGQMLPSTAIEEALRIKQTNLAQQIKKDKTILYDTYTNVFLSCSHYRTILNYEIINRCLLQVALFRNNVLSISHSFAISSNDSLNVVYVNNTLLWNISKTLLCLQRQ